ncbi:MAG: hypothetical protein M1358_16925, partial [Chloroflexi bacterium]|nr:hypothetical protein [Chloroflexota bacterium]
LSTLIKEHPDWFKLLGQRRERKSYAIDYDNPEAREYLRSVLRDYFEKYDVDGIKVDGLGNADGALLNQDRPDQFGLVGGLVGQTLEIYRFIYENARSIKDDAYIESGWMTPVLANPYAHTFRFGDEYPSFSNNYPTPGMVQHLDYAVWQKMALGQQSNMGAVFGDPNASLVNLWWLQAGVALGTQTVLSFDLPAMTLETLSQFRSILAHYDAFEGRTVYERSLQPSYFATTVGSTTYLGVLNRGVEPKPFYVALQDLGLDVSNKRVVVYDVTGKRFSRPRDRIRAELYPEGFRFYVIRGAPGVVWTNSSLHDEKATDSSFQVEVRGPRALDGFAYIYAPQPREVSIDGRALTPSLISLADSDHYAYDARNRIVTLSYDHDAPHVIKVEYK